METLEELLEQAKSDPSCKNATVLNADLFYIIRGPTSPTFRERLEAALSNSDDLVTIRQRNSQDGLEIIEPVQAGIRGGYWYLRNLSSGSEIFPAGEGQYTSVVHALHAAIEWWHAETWCRSIVVRRHHVDQPAAGP